MVEVWHWPLGIEEDAENDNDIDDRDWGPPQRGHLIETYGARVAAMMQEHFKRWWYTPDFVPKGTFVYSKAKRDKLILMGLRAGRTNPEIAAHLGLTTPTVKAYVSELLQDLGAATRMQAVLVAMDRGLIPGPRNGR